jgi:CRP-like cAMP-binding protein
LPTRNRILNSLSDSPPLELSAFELVHGKVLHPSGSSIRHVYFPTSGIVSLLAVTRAGEAIETAIVGREGVVGASTAMFGNVAFGQATVQMTGSALRMTREAFVKAYGANARFRAAVNGHLAVIMVQIQQSAACHALHSVEQRLSRWLLHSRDTAGSDQIKLTQEFLSHMLGVRRATVSIAAVALQDAGLIRYSRGKITVLGQPGMGRRSCECYEVVRQYTAKYLKALDQ